MNPKNAIKILLLLMFLCSIGKSQKLVFYKPGQKKEYHFRQNQVLTFYLKDKSKHKGSIVSISENQIVMATEKNGQITIENNSLMGFSARHHLWYFGAHWASLIRYTKKRSLRGYKYKLII